MHRKSLSDILHQSERETLSQAWGQTEAAEDFAPRFHQRHIHSISLPNEIDGISEAISRPPRPPDAGNEGGATQFDPIRRGGREGVDVHGFNR